ncbi:hypothetical protein [Luteimonas sp. 3794]|uniref:hypothetical protein n=1 Tax=Luteimonas sp. 3794 TaxID=2817730 RepID=UPI00285D38DC|nr:hypothetical protein [Luteimonas sp. 3794]MDR6991430.1 hypothetical protein [Luteimonas sp. 3794]
MSPAGLRALLIAALALLPATALGAEQPVDRLRQAILDAAATGSADPVEAVVSTLRYGEGIEIEVTLEDEHGEPLADCLPRNARPAGAISTATAVSTSSATPMSVAPDCSRRSS